MRGHKYLAARDARRALKLFNDARWALYADLNAAGPDEVKQNPSLLRRERLLTQVDRFLTRLAAAKTKKHLESA